MADPADPEKPAAPVDPALIGKEPELMQRLDALISDYNTRVAQAADALKQKYFAVGLVPPTVDVAALASLLDQYAKAFAELAAPAKALSDAGKKDLSQKLAPFLDDARKAADIYQNMASNAVSEEGKRAAIMADAGTYVTAAIQSVEQTRENVYAAANAAWSNELKS